MSCVKIPCAIIRGGTSKGVFFHDKDLPQDPQEREQIILLTFGSPDPRQIDGLGGADPLTSKLAIIKPSKREGIDIDYTFGQVNVDEPSINYSLNCGNISSGAAIFAVDEGLVKLEEPITNVNIYNTNTGVTISAEVRVSHGKAATMGDFSIDGVPRKGSLIKLTFLNTSGAITGELLPTKNLVDSILLSNGREIDISVVDAGNLYIFVESNDLGLIGNEKPQEIEANKEVMALVEEMFNICTQMVNDRIKGEKNIKVQKMALVSNVRDIANSDIPSEASEDRSQQDVDFISRIISSNGKAHKAYAVTGAISAGSAAHLKGSVVNRVLNESPKQELSIGHPQGTINIGIECKELEGQLLPVSATIKRTARYIMDGYVYIR